MEYCDGSTLNPLNGAPQSFLNHISRQGGSESDGRKILSYYLNKNLESKSPPVTKALLDQIDSPQTLKLEACVESSVDSFRKLIFRTTDELAVESVLIPLLKQNTMSVCLSSQVGCVMGCVFCATARIKKRRNLETSEIVEQFVYARNQALKIGKVVRSVVFMGMGEPFLNYDRVLNAAELICFPVKNAIAADSITISTVGMKNEIERFTRERRKFRLSVSLGAATDEKRAKLVPIAAKTPLRELRKAIYEYTADRKQRINISYVCISGENVSIEDAQAIGALFADIPIRLDLIDVTDATGTFKAPSQIELDVFRDALRHYLNQPVARRYSGGADINAACGTLAGDYQTESLISSA